MSIATGITGHGNVNYYAAFEEGLKTMKKINSKDFKEAKLSRKDKIIPLLASTSKIQVNNDFVPIDLLLLFQRICVLKNRMKNSKIIWLLN